MLLLETVGLGLAVAPLIIELLKAKPEPVHAINAVKKHKAKEMMTGFYAELGFEVVMLKVTLGQLVNGLPVDEETKLKLVDDSHLDPSVWKSPSNELQAVLRQRLSHCYEPFIHSLERLLTLLSMLVDDKSLPVPLKRNEIRVCQGTSYWRLEELFDARQPSLRGRLRLGWKKEKRDKLLKSISKHNERLEKFLARTSNIENVHAPEPRQSVATLSPHFEGLRQRILDLRRAIARIWCKCLGKHEIRLGLFKTWRNSERVSFDMLMNLPKDDQVWHWGESKLDIYLTDTSQPPADSAIDLGISLRSTAHRRSSSNLTGVTYTVESEPSSRHNSLSGCTPVASPSSDDRDDKAFDSRRSSQVFPGHFLVEDICKTANKMQKHRRASQLHFRGDAIWQSSMIIMAEVERSESGVSLEEHLNMKERKLSKKSRKILQVLLAQSVLFFPWTRSDLDKGSIAFHNDINKPFAKIEPDHGEGDSNGEARNEELCKDEETKDFEYTMCNNETLAALGITLLELELGKPIEKMQTEEDEEEGSSAFETKVWATMRILKERDEDITKGTLAAIDACIRCDFKVQKPTFDNMAFLQEVYERIVAPLEHELSFGFELDLPFFSVGDQQDGYNEDRRRPAHRRSNVALIQEPPRRKTVKLAVDLETEWSDEKNSTAMGRMGAPNLVPP